MAGAIDALFKLDVRVHPEPPRPGRREAGFDCTAPVASTVSAPRARASPKWNSSWRTSSPPEASPVQSSRLIHRSTPRAAPRRGAGSSGVGACPSRTR